MTKATNYLLTATEVKTMVNQQQSVSDTQQSVIKPGNIGVTNNFYVNGVDWRRGKGAVDGIPEANQNKLKSHTTALKEAVKVILS